MLIDPSGSGKFQIYESDSSRTTGVISRRAKVYGVSKIKVNNNRVIKTYEGVQV
jgi:hypothetical protein